MSKMLTTIIDRKNEAKEISVTSFYGGSEHGKCIQLNIGTEYIQLDIEDVTLLCDALLAWIYYT